MIHLVSGANNIVVTLNELKTLDSPEYVLILVNEDTRKKVACKLGTDLSTYPERYNKFLVTVTNTPTALSSQVKLANLGDYKYFIYEMADADTFSYSTVNTLDLDTLTGEVERGKVKYSGTDTVIKSYKDIKPSIIANE